MLFSFFHGAKTQKYETLVEEICWTFTEQFLYLVYIKVTKVYIKAFINEGQCQLQELWVRKQDSLFSFWMNVGKTFFSKLLACWFDIFCIIEFLRILFICLTFIYSVFIMADILKKKLSHRSLVLLLIKELSGTDEEDILKKLEKYLEERVNLRWENTGIITEK